MDFSELYKQSQYLSRFSPNGQYIASAFKQKLAFREASSLQILSIHTSTDLIENIAWSADSELLITTSYKAGIINIWSVSDEKWSAKIEEGTVGLTNARWSPDGRSVLCFSDFQVRVTIWSLTSGEACFIQFPKYSDKGFDFRKDGKYFVLAERRDGKDFVGIYDCNNAWTLLKHFQVDTVDLENLAWSPDGRYIAIWDKCIDYKVLIYTPDGRRQQSFSAYNMGLGVKTAVWAPSSQFLAVGSYDQKIRFLNHYTWTPTLEFTHINPVNNIDNLIIMRETREMKDRQSTRKYVIDQQPMELPEIRPDPEKPNPKLGVGSCKFNANGTLVASRNDNMPNSLWIWDISLLKPITIFMQLMPIRNFLWNPRYPNQLVLCCGSEYIYIWSGPEVGAEIIEVPQVNFLVNNFRWNPDGHSLLLMDKE
ncbi:11479_t:CDS:10, partial [Ambispora leptoticha]